MKAILSEASAYVEAHFGTKEPSWADARGPSLQGPAVKPSAPDLENAADGGFQIAS